jgi:hypothetical protein
VAGGDNENNFYDEYYDGYEDTYDELESAG